MSRFKGRSKYGAKKVKIGDLKFDSQREAKRWCDLQLLEKAGEISELERQIPIYLEGRDRFIPTKTGRRMRYIADFRYKDKDGNVVWEDSKGYPTPEYIVKRGILWAMGIEIVEV